MPCAVPHSPSVRVESVQGSASGPMGLQSAALEKIRLSGSRSANARHRSNRSQLRCKRRKLSRALASVVRAAMRAQTSAYLWHWRMSRRSDTARPLNRTEPPLPKLDKNTRNGNPVPRQTGEELARARVAAKADHARAIFGGRAKSLAEISF